VIAESHITMMKELLEAVFSVTSDPRLYAGTRIGAVVWKIATLGALNAWGYNWATLFVGESGLPGWENVKIDSVRYGYEPRGIRTRERLRWRGPAAIVNYTPVLSSESVPHTNKPVIV
jgi:hypothetical protein